MMLMLSIEERYIEVVVGSMLVKLLFVHVQHRNSCRVS